MSSPGQTTRSSRFFCPALTGVSTGGLQPESGSDTGQDTGVSDARCLLDKEDTHHARKVLRLSAGDGVELFDGQGTLAQAVLEEYSSGKAVCRVISVQRFNPPKPTLTVATAIPKGPRADAMVQQLSQLGADRLIPLRAEHSVVDPRPTKLERFKKLAVQSAKQCGRLTLMRVEPVCALDEVWSEPGYDLKLLACLAGGAPADLPKRLASSSHVLVLIGPEGGWSTQEQASASASGCLDWGLGPHVLRVETAATSAAAVIRYLARP